MRTHHVVPTALLAWFTAVPAAVAGAPCNMIFPPSQAADVPDPSFIDGNGDGIDGMACGPVFVALSGNDSSAGTMDAPMRTIQAAILAAAALTPTRDVYVSKGVYEEFVVLRSGVNVYGGYDAADGWSRASTNATVIAGGTTAVYAQNLHAPTTLDLIDVVSATPPVFGADSIGVLARANTAALTIRGVSISTGHGQMGAHGVDGSQGAAGGNGGQGGPGACDNQNAPGGGGVPGASAAGNLGGIGGTGGHAGTGYNGANGAQGGGGGGTGGAGGSGGATGGNADPGQPGASGAHGIHGANGAGFFASGSAGAVGANGRGGGGGGGGGGQFGPFITNGSGNGGGGGGGGGQGGQPGTGGAHGGSSFGVVAIDADLTAIDSAFTLGNGAQGGNGGAGSSGGGGGMGGPGNTFCDSEVGRGGNGAPGGSGGNGGHGGAGVGGNSIGVLSVDPMRATIDIVNCSFMLGAPGAGGASQTGGAPDGVSDEIVFAGVAPPIATTVAPNGVHARLWTTMGLPSLPTTAFVADRDLADAHSFIVLQQPQNGFVGTDGVNFVYTPNVGFVGSDFFVIRAQDTSGQIVQGFAVVHVLGTPPECPGDINGDGVVDFADFSALLANYGNNCN